MKAQLLSFFISAMLLVTFAAPTREPSPDDVHDIVSLDDGGGLGAMMTVLKRKSAEDSSIVDVDGKNLDGTVL
ncbi:hypothetical protein BJ165DRAFT_1520026 [Panaeolus papilionaceus]|nr:hypothetical protein BJ165DRAFT_1520026 [Panaeolus papilionaceus]